MASSPASACASCTRLEDGLDGADVVMMLRVQSERFEGEASRFPNTRELSRTFGLSERTLGYAKPDAIVMHPGPMNRGVEISPQVADGPRAVILQQVSLGRRDADGGARARDPRDAAVSDAAARARRRPAIVKVFGNHVAVDDVSFEVPRGVRLRHPRAERRRQVDDAADDQRHHRARSRRRSRSSTGSTPGTEAAAARSATCPRSVACIRR